jgi:ABC-type uncharacterized transport system YnjBCD ATPase subunit
LPAFKEKDLRRMRISLTALFLGTISIKTVESYLPVSLNSSVSQTKEVVQLMGPTAPICSYVLLFLLKDALATEYETQNPKDFPTCFGG